MIILRYKPLASGKYSLYLDCYDETSKERNYEFLKLYVSKDYSKIPNISTWDKAIMEQANEILQQRINEFFPETKQEKPVETILDFIISLNEPKNKYKKQVIKHLTSFEEINPTKLSNITTEWVNQLEEYLLTKLKASSTDSLLFLVKKYFDSAASKGLIQKSPFNEYKIKGRKNPDLIFLEDGEIQALQDTPVTFNPQIVDAFFFSLETGLQLQHVKNLQHGQIETDEEKNNYWITLNYLNSNETYTVKFNDAAIQILKKYQGTGLVFDRLPNKPNCNIKLHLWGAMAELNKTLSFSLARNTFIINCFEEGKLLKDVMYEAGIKRHNSLRKYKEKYRNNGNTTI